MAIESIDRIVRMNIADMPEICEVIGACGMIITIKVESMLNGLWYKVTELGNEIWADYPPEACFNVLVPDSLNDPVTQAEMILALSDKVIDF